MIKNFNKIIEGILLHKNNVDISNEAVEVLSIMKYIIDEKERFMPQDDLYKYMIMIIGNLAEFKNETIIEALTDPIFMEFIEAAPEERGDIFKDQCNWCMDRLKKLS